MAVRLFTEQCLQRRLHRSVTMMVPSIGFFRRKSTVVRPKRENSSKVETFICFKIVNLPAQVKEKIDFRLQIVA